MSTSYFVLSKNKKSKPVEMTNKSSQLHNLGVNYSLFSNKQENKIQNERKNITIGDKDISINNFKSSFLAKECSVSQKKLKTPHISFANLNTRVDQQKLTSNPALNQNIHKRAISQFQLVNKYMYPFIDSPIRVKKSSPNKPMEKIYKKTQNEMFQKEKRKVSLEKIPSFLKKIIKRKQGNKTVQKNSFLHDTLETMPCSFLRKIHSSNFQFIQKIGHGGYGNVYLCRQIYTKFICAIKKISKRKIKQLKLEDNIVRQLKLQSYITHPNVAQAYGFFEEQDYIYIVLQYLPGGDLQKKYISKTKLSSEQQVSDFIYQICLGLKQLHQQNIIHRDIKPQNIFFFYGIVKIGDFGCSIFSEKLRDTVLGTLQYLSPEQLREERYCKLIDSWSVGILAYQLLYGKSPFKQDLIKIINSGKEKRLLSQLQFPERIPVSDEAKDFIKKLLRDKADNRMSMNQALRHNFLQSARKRKLDTLKQAQSLFKAQLLQNKKFYK